MEKFTWIVKFLNYFSYMISSHGQLNLKRNYSNFLVEWNNYLSNYYTYNINLNVQFKHIFIILATKQQKIKFKYSLYIINIISYYFKIKKKDRDGELTYRDFFSPLPPSFRRINLWEKLTCLVELGSKHPLTANHIHAKISKNMYLVVGEHWTLKSCMASVWRICKMWVWSRILQRS